MCFRPTAVEGGTICPNCGEKLEFDLNGLEDEDKPQDEE